MSDQQFISDEQINALIDNQLDADDHARILHLSLKDNTLARRIENCRRQKEILRFAYQDKKPDGRFSGLQINNFRWQSMIAATLLFIVGNVAGIAGLTLYSANNTQQLIEQVALREAAPEKMILQISSNDPLRIESALADAELLLRESKLNKKAIQLEIIANAAGLEMLRTSSPYQSKVTKIATSHDNVRFLACGTGMAKYKNKGINLKLIPQAKVVSAVTTQVAMRLNQGWSYLRE